jgi:4-hydroxy-tetrahydrodipicolinate synthase
VGRAARQLVLSGAFAAALTPHRPGTHEIDFSALLDLIDFLAFGGVSAICLMTPTGEFLNYSFSDRQRAVYLGVKRSRVPLVACVAHPTFAGAVQLAEEAISAGADGLLILPPPFFQYDQPEIEAFCRRLAEEAGDAVPLILGNLPQYASPIGVETAERLLATGLFAALIDGSGDSAQFTRLSALRAQYSFALFGGDDSTAFESLTRQAEGIYSESACALPELVSALCRTESPELARHLTDFARTLDRFPALLALHRAVQIRGQKTALPDFPLSPGTAQEFETFAAWFREWWHAVIKSAKSATA